MKYNPAGNLIVCRPLSQSEITEGGVYIPETSQKLLDECIVLEVGPKVDQSLFINGLKEGDRIVVRRYSGSWLKLSKGGDQLGVNTELNRLICEDEDVLTIPTTDA